VEGEREKVKGGKWKVEGVKGKNRKSEILNSKL